MSRLLYSNGERQASSRNRPISFRAPLVFASMRGCINIFYDTSSFLYLFQCYHVERKKILIYRISDFRAEKRFWCTESQVFVQKKDFGAQNLGFSCRKKILMHRISDFRAEKRFWCTESRIFVQKKDFGAQNLRFSCRKKILMHRISDFGVEKRFSCTKCRSLRRK